MVQTLGRFSFSNGKVSFNEVDGAMSAEDVSAYAMLQILEILENIDDRLHGVEHALTEGEIKVHRTQ